MRDGGAMRDSIAPWNALENSKTMLLITSAKQKMKICVRARVRRAEPGGGEAHHHQQCKEREPRLARAAAVGDGAEERRQHGGGDAGIEDGVAPQVLSAQIVVHHRAAQERRDDEDLEDDVGIARAFVQRPRPLPAPARGLAFAEKLRRAGLGRDQRLAGLGLIGRRALVAYEEHQHQADAEEQRLAEQADALAVRHERQPGRRSRWRERSSTCPTANRARRTPSSSPAARCAPASCGCWHSPP